MYGSFIVMKYVGFVSFRFFVYIYIYIMIRFVILFIGVNIKFICNNMDVLVFFDKMNI